MKYLNGQLKKNHLYRYRQVMSALSVVIPFRSGPEAPIEDDVNSTRQEAFGDIPLQLLDKVLTVVPRRGLGIVRIQRPDPNVPTQQDPIASPLKLIGPCRLARTRQSAQHIKSRLHDPCTNQVLGIPVPEHTAKRSFGMPRHPEGTTWDLALLPSQFRIEAESGAPALVDIRRARTA